MYIQNTVKALRNKYDNFYYNGIEISKLNFEIDKFATICNKINELKHQLFQEKNLMFIREIKKVTAMVPITGTNIILVGSLHKKECSFGLYDKDIKEIIPLTDDIFQKLNSETFIDFAYILNKTASRINNGIIEETMIQDSQLLVIWESYQNEINKLENSFQHTYELEFVNGYKDFILTDEELSRACLESYQ